MPNAFSELHVCPGCGTPNMGKMLYFGFPGRQCLHCYTATGPAAWLADIYFFGGFARYEGSYLKALWGFLRGDYNEAEEL